MAWLNAQGNPVAIKPHSFQLDLPEEAVGDEKMALSGVNFLAVIMAVMAVFAALKSGNPAAIIAAVQALMDALMGK